jgi:hypothetical protein
VPANRTADARPASKAVKAVTFPPTHPSGILTFVHCVGLLLAVAGPVVLHDYETNCEVEDLSSPLSHAGLVKCYLEGNWPA